MRENHERRLEGRKGDMKSRQEGAETRGNEDMKERGKEGEV